MKLVAGLFPRMRGTHQQPVRQAAGARLIPAGAGNTTLAPRIYSCPTVYPRWRGEHWFWQDVYSRKIGLSPPARGTPTLIRPMNPICRFIPAGAGNTFLTQSSRQLLSVYPRWRGEHGCTAFQARFADGLSPLARGTLHGEPTNDQINRFIPAGAGNTPGYSARKIPRPVYPRWRGEHSHTVRDSSSALGLSPLARGTPQWVITELVILRFIPAGAWNTSLENASSAAYPVYPRWRGEHMMFA